MLTDRLPVGLLALTAVSGILDAVSFLALGRIFTANMTGNVVFLAFAAVGTPGISVARPLTSLAAFLSGAAIASYFNRATAGPIQRHRLRVSATCEVALLFALAMGLRTATVQQLAVPGLTSTTMVTTTLTGLVADLALAGSIDSRSSRRVGSIASLFVGAATGALLLRLGLAVPLMVAAVCVLAATAYAASKSARSDKLQSR
jgi:uncharacterized membrane protein YoaK (UPF0700 family)